MAPGSAYNDSEVVLIVESDNFEVWVDGWFLILINLYRKIIIRRERNLVRSWKLRRLINRFVILWVGGGHGVSGDCDSRLKSGVGQRKEKYLFDTSAN